MAMIEEMNASGNWLFRRRSFLPLVLYALAFIVIAAEWDEDLPLFDANWAWGCLAISLLGQIIRAITIGYTPMGTSGRNTKEGQVAETLNTKGIYSTVRHPLYLGNFFIWLGLIIYVGNGWFTILCCLLFWLYYERIMFAEEFFLRNKFGQTYLNWAEKTPPFLPNFLKWSGAGWKFSVRNVLKREYSGFFAIFLSFALIDATKNYFHIGFTSWEKLISPFWLLLTGIAFIILIVLRSLKKYTKTLDEKGREFYA